MRLRLREDVTGSLCKFTLLLHRFGRVCVNIQVSVAVAVFKKACLIISFGLNEMIGRAACLPTARALIVPERRLPQGRYVAKGTVTQMQANDHRPQRPLSC